MPVAVMAEVAFLTERSKIPEAVVVLVVVEVCRSQDNPSEFVAVKG
jgi:hypothetical protein